MTETADDIIAKIEKLKVQQAELEVKLAKQKQTDELEEMIQKNSTLSHEDQVDNIFEFCGKHNIQDWGQKLKDIIFIKMLELIPKIRKDYNRYQAEAKKLRYDIEFVREDQPNLKS
jgi:F0F1-type ATP synthase delta subunit